MFVTAVLLFLWLLHWSELFVCIKVGLKKLRELVERSQQAANWLHAGQWEVRGDWCVCSEVVREEEWLWREGPGFVYLDETKRSLLLLLPLLVSTVLAAQACMCDSTSSTQWDLQPMKRLWELEICFPAHVNMKAISGTTPLCLCFYFNLQQCFLLLPLSICLLLFLRCHCCHHFQTLHTDRSLHTNVTCLHSALRLPKEVKWNHLKQAGRRMTEPWSRPSARCLTGAETSVIWWGGVTAGGRSSAVITVCRLMHDGSGETINSCESGMNLFPHSVTTICTSVCILQVLCIRSSSVCPGDNHHNTHAPRTSNLSSTAVNNDINGTMCWILSSINPL